MASIFKAGVIMKDYYVIDIDYEPTEYKIEVTTEHDCGDMPLNERCIDCLTSYYDTKMQMDEDSYRDRD